MTSTPGAAGARAGRLRLRTLLIAGAASCGTGLLLAACSAGSGGGTSSGSVRLPSEHGAVGAPAQAPGTAGNGAARSAYGTAGGTSSARTLVTLSTQDIIRTAYLTVRVPKNTTVTGQANIASGLVTATGGYVSGEEDLLPPGGGTPQVTLQLKIPSAQYGTVLPKLVGLGKQLSLSQHATDVTQQVADVGSRVASAQAAIRQLRLLLTKAGSVGALLAVQDEINAQESNLEALLAQQRALAHETSYATVTLVLIGHRHHVVVHHPKKSHVPGFLSGLKAGWHALAVAVGWLLTALGSLLPFLIPAAVLAAIAVAARRLRRRRRPPAAEPPAAPAA
ncbi:MAG TPA: DUF4349 domain-containing protein [Streptosporangiaceae bacterium]